MKIGAGDRPNMRLCLVTQLCCLLILSLGSAPAAGGVSLESVSLRAGGSYSAVEGSFHDVVDGYVVGFTAAGGLGLRLGPVPIQAELWVIRKGGRMGSLTFSDSTFGGFTFPALRWLVSYVGVPVLAKLEFGGWRAARPYVILGPGLAYRFGGSVEQEGDFYYTSPGVRGRLQGARIFEDLSLNPLSDLRRFDMDAIAGAGLTLGQGRNRVLLEARWLEGLLNVLPEGSELKGRNRAITVTLGLERR